MQYIYLLHVKFEDASSVSFCGWAGGFVSIFVGNSEDKFIAFGSCHFSQKCDKIHFYLLELFLLNFHFPGP